MAIKIWSIKNPVFSGVLLVSVLSQVAGAAESPASQLASTPGTSTPDQLVRQMARNMVLSSRSANIPSSSGFDRIVPSSKVAALPIANKRAPSSPVSVASKCSGNSCGFVATHPPVDLGTSLSRGIAKIEQNKFTDPVRSTTPLNQASIAAPLTATPNDQIAKAAIMSLRVEPGFSKDVAFGQTVTAVSPIVAVNKTAPAVISTSIVSEVSDSEKSIGVGSFQNQLSSFTGQLVANSWKMMDVLPKPQLDSSLLNIGSSGFAKRVDLPSFNSRFTLGSSVTVAMVSPEIFNSLSAEPLIVSGGSKNAKSLAVDPFPLNKSNFLAQPLGSDGSKLSFVPNSFSASSNPEVLANPFNTTTLPAAVNSSKMSTNKFGN
jgi:hypothetical protein